MDAGTTTTEALKHLYKEGGVVRFYRGLGPALLQVSSTVRPACSLPCAWHVDRVRVGRNGAKREARACSVLKPCCSFTRCRRARCRALVTPPPTQVGAGGIFCLAPYACHPAHCCLCGPVKLALHAFEQVLLGHAHCPPHRQCVCPPPTSNSTLPNPAGMLALLEDVDMPTTPRMPLSCHRWLQTASPKTPLLKPPGMLALLEDVDMPVALKTMAASGAAASFRILLMPVDAMKTIMQACVAAVLCAVLVC